MPSVVRKWLQVLEERYGVRREFAGHLMPLLERLSQQQPSVEEWDRLLHGVAAAYRTGAADAPEGGSGAEAGALVEQFCDEMRKMDESLKVLTACLQRLEREVKLPNAPPCAPFLH